MKNFKNSKKIFFLLFFWKLCLGMQRICIRGTLPITHTKDLLLTSCSPYFKIFHWSKLVLEVWPFGYFLLPKFFRKVPKWAHVVSFCCNMPAAAFVDLRVLVLLPLFEFNSAESNSSSYIVWPEHFFVIVENFREIVVEKCGNSSA